MEQLTYIPVCYDDDDDEERSIPLKDTIIFGLPPCVAITPALSTKELVDSLIMENEHLDTIPEMESDEFIKSSVENLVQNPSESEDFSDIESECDMPVCDNFTTFSNLLFDANDDFSSSDDESFSNEDVPNEIYSNSLFDEDIISFKIDASIISMINSLLEQFSAFQANSDTIIESFPTFPIPVEDSDSLREEIDIFPGPDDSIPPGIESDDFDSEDDDKSTFIPEFESFHVDYPDSGDSTIDVVKDIPVDMPNILPTHPALQLDFDFIPSNDLGSNLDISSPSGDRNKIYDPGIYIEVESMRFLATLSPVIDTLILFSSENEDKVFNHGVLASKKKSPPSSSHRGLKASKLFHHKSPMLIHGDNTPNLGSDSDCDLSLCDDFSLINVYEEKSVTFSNPLFDSNDDFTSSDDESLSDEDVPKENVKIYSNPLFEFDDEYISSDVNSLLDQVLEDIESGDVDEIEFLLLRDPSKISVDSILEGFTDEPPLEENDDLFDLESKENEWKKILHDASIDDLMTEDKNFDPGIPEKFFSPTYVKLPFEDRHCFSYTYVIQIFLPYFTYLVESPFLLSSGSEDTIFDPDIFAFHFSSLEPVASHRSGTFMCFNVYLNILNESPIEICSSTCFVPNISIIWGESS
ncbi:hypothetical protein Tco_1218630 [Tanacetum coccineum]